MYIFPTALRCVIGIFLLAIVSTGLASTDLRSVAEQSNFQRTGRYLEVEQLCHQFAQRYPQQVKCHEYGRTPENRPMLALAISNQAALTPKLAKARGLPVVLVVGGIHAGEVDGKDAGLLLLRQLLANKDPVLDQLVWLFVPVFNVDGHERFGAWNRPNQRGPEKMGWRTTAQNFNLNRDYTKLDTPEMQAMMRLIADWDVLANVDLHVTDGAKFEHDISIQVEPVNAGDAQLRRSGRSLRDSVIARLAQQGSLPMPFYYDFEEEDNPASGFADLLFNPRYSHCYFQLRNRFGMLVEAHSWKDYPTRVKITRNAIFAVLQEMALHGKEWRAQALAADLAASQIAGASLPLTYKTGPQARQIDFRGYAYTRSKSAISGAMRIEYDESQPQIWHVPLRDEISPDITASVPRGGYFVEAAYASWLAPKLDLHGIHYRRLKSDMHGEQSVQVWRAEKFSFEAKSVENHLRVDAQGSWHTEQKRLPAGGLLIPSQQAKVRLLLTLLEPSAPDSFLSWGFFNTSFERKEYMEAYVAEDVARQQLAASASLQQEFAARLANDAEFAKDPEKRLEFFAKRHPSWDERYLQYPIYRLEQLPK